MNTNTPPNSPDRLSPDPFPRDRRIDSEWQRQEAARAQDAGCDPLYRALDTAARQPLPASLPADFMAGIEARLSRPSADDRFEVGLLSLVLGLGGLLSLLFVLPLMNNLVGNLDLSLPDVHTLEVSWGLIGVSALGLTALMSGAVERIRNRHH